MRTYTLDWFVKAYNVDVCSSAYFNITEVNHSPFHSNYTTVDYFYKIMEKYPKAQISDIGQRKESNRTVWVIDIII